MATRELTAQNFKQTVYGNDNVLVYIWAPLCPPCAVLTPTYEGSSDKHPDIVHGKINFETEQELVSIAGVTLLPTLMAFKKASWCSSRPVSPTPPSWTTWCGSSGPTGSTCRHGSRGCSEFGGTNPPARGVRPVMATKDLTAAQFNETVNDNDMVLVDFWASWCGPCRSFAPTFQASSEKHPDVVYAKVNTEEEQELAAAAQIRSIPTLMAFKKGQLLFNQPGALPPAALEDLVQQLKAYEVA